MVQRAILHLACGTAKDTLVWTAGARIGPSAGASLRAVPKSSWLYGRRSAGQTALPRKNLLLFSIASELDHAINGVRHLCWFRMIAKGRSSSDRKRRETWMFQDGVLLITGGTGSFGNAVLRAFLHSDIGEIRIFSRDEKKQDDQRKFYHSNKLKYYVGDVRDYASVLNAIRGADYVFHAAALKQVPSCEFHPMEAVKTNVIGTENVLEAAIVNRVRRAICLSTDKAVYPINAMGISKAMMEKVMVAKSRSLNSASTIICCTRYGNVMASRGSVIPLFVEQIRRGQPITI